MQCTHSKNMSRGVYMVDFISAPNVPTNRTIKPIWKDILRRNIDASGYDLCMDYLRLMYPFNVYK